VRTPTPLAALFLIAASALAPRARAEEPVSAPSSGPGFGDPPPPAVLAPPPLAVAPPPLVPTAPPPPLRATAKPLAPLGTGLTVAALASLGLGTGLLVAGKNGETTCGLTGCWQRPDIPKRVAGSAFLAAGAGMAAVALPTALYGAASDGKVRGRTDEKRVRAALVLGSLGLGVGAAGVTVAAQDRSLTHALGHRGVGVGVGVPLALLGGGLAIAALPLGVSGMARDPKPEGDEDKPTEPAAPGGEKRARLGIAVPGLVVTAMGAGMLAGGATLAARGSQDWTYGVSAMILLAAGGVHALVGIPMTIAGFIPVKAPLPPAATPQTALLPQVQVGPGSLQLRWDF
jgi:hypothetical protein